MYLTVAAIVVLGGCGSSKTDTTASTATTDTTAATVSLCATAQLAVSLGQPKGTAGTIDYPLILHNTGSAKCTVQGYAGVSFV
ncbi:MAG: DUF4232 domain-containing protein, partial [Mycobacterium sp.]